MRLFEAARPRIWDLVRQRDFAQATELVDQLLTVAEGQELALSLDLKAWVMVREDVRNIPVAIALIENAFHLAEQDPGLQAHLLVGVLGYCCSLGDVDRAMKHERQVAWLLKHHSDHPGVARFSPLLHQACGRTAQLSGEYAVALWHFLRAEEAYQSVTGEDAVIWQCYRSGNFGNLFVMYLHLGRTDEARGALDQAGALCPESAPNSKVWVAENEVRWGLSQRDLGHARQWLSVLGECFEQVDSVDLEVKIHILEARIALEEARMTHFHRCLSKAHTLAVANGLDSLLADIQRLQRTPTAIGL